MLSVMELFIIIALHLLMMVQSSEGPNMKVSPDVVRESKSVHLNCESPADVTVIQCYFYANGEKYKDIKLSPSCDLSLTGAEVLLWTGLKSPVSLDIACYYTTDVSGVLKPSDHSPPVTLTILDDLIKPIISVDDIASTLSISCLIPESDRNDFTCNLYTEDGPLRHRRHSHRTQSGDHCVFFISLSEIFTHKQTVNRHLSCDYSFRTDPEMNLTSPRSDLYTIRGFPQAVLRVSPSVITDTVQMNCLNRESLNMDTCFFTVDGMESNMKESRSCHLSLTESDIIHWSGGQRSSIIITCYYTVFKSQVLLPSPQSEPVTVAVWKLFKAVLTASSSVITDTDTVQIDCKNRDNLKMDTCFFIIDRSRMQEERSCQLSLTGYDIIHGSGGQRSSVSITCFYSGQSHGFESSPHSDPVTVTVQKMWIKILSGAVCSVFVLTGLICLWRCVCKNRKKRQGPAVETCVSGPEESFSMITSVPDTSHQRGLKHPQSLQDSKSGPLLITLFKPTDDLDNTQQKMGFTEDNENVYHMYCTIQDNDVNVDDGDQHYSMAF
ncbi:uncharacterized protein LOC130410449 [Triplophysa dalaica]|uniref:uncharacterized protein LOC130410449 n=1 Tax=Triplophysa dalaica TaxID=1582913 RepID=UPI0024DF8885|nr:uncharacterized protein LOC130410449 [Triplophysa dalaica]